MDKIIEEFTRRLIEHQEWVDKNFAVLDREQKRQVLQAVMSNLKKWKKS